MRDRTARDRLASRKNWGTSTSKSHLHWARGWDILTSVKLTARQIERLVKEGEVVHTECKDASGGLPDSLWESYSSFANTDGGVILLGVKEVNRKFSIVGVPKAATLIKRFWDGINNREKVSVNIFALVDIGERSGTGLSNPGCAGARCGSARCAASATGSRGLRTRR